MTRLSLTGRLRPPLYREDTGMNNVYKESDNSTIALQYKGKGDRKYNTIALYDSPLHLIDTLKGKVSDNVMLALQQNAFGFVIRGAKMSFNALDGGRYQIENMR